MTNRVEDAFKKEMEQGEILHRLTDEDIAKISAFKDIQHEPDA